MVFYYFIILIFPLNLLKNFCSVSPSFLNTNFMFTFSFEISCVYILWRFYEEEEPIKFIGASISLMVCYQDAVGGEESTSSFVFRAVSLRCSLLAQLFLYAIASHYNDEGVGCSILCSTYKSRLRCFWFFPFQLLISLLKRHWIYYGPREISWRLMDWNLALRKDILQHQTNVLRDVKPLIIYFDNMTFFHLM